MSTVFVPVWTERLLRVALQQGIQTGVRIRGRAVCDDTTWATGPVGEERIGPGIYDRYATAKNLQIKPRPDAGLIVDFDSMSSPTFDAKKLQPSIREFYEHTTAWSMDVGVHWRGLVRYCAKTLLYLVSREIEQVNVPLSQADVAAGISSTILPLENNAGERVYTGWLRQLNTDDSVIYAGFYTTAIAPNLEVPCVKVAFPMPKGCTTVVLKPENLADGGLRLSSSGKRFGDSGTYRLHGTGSGARVAYIPMHERLDLWVERNGEVVRCDHHFALWRFEFLVLKYYMKRKAH